MPHIYVDADGCPVKDEIYRVATRYQLPVTLVANSPMRTPDTPNLTFQLVDDGFDAADDWIVEHAQTNDIVITTDIPLAARCLENGAHAIAPNGRLFTQDTIGEALASREVSAQLREHGLITGGPAPFNKTHRSNFLQQLDNTIHTARRAT